MKQLILTLVILYTGTSLCAQNTVSFESAWEAVEHMRLGWNLGNTLDSNSGDTLYMWIEHWTDRMPAAYEKAWGQTADVIQPVLVSSGRGFDKDNTCYDLKGCRITNSTEQSGIIIRNGKKVIRK